MNITHERMNNVFSKYHVHGLPVEGSFNHFTGVEAGIHCHPFDFTSHVLSGGYKEKVYRLYGKGVWGYEIIHRNPGTSHFVEAATIHEIIDLPEGECVTFITHGKHTRKSYEWKFEESGIWVREWNEKEFKKYEK